jgi:hypothetical protein
VGKTWEKHGENDENMGKHGEIDEKSYGRWWEKI